MLQSLLQTDDRLCRRYFDHESHLHLYLHLHAAERYGRRYVDGLRVLPPVRLRLVRQCRRYFHFDIQFWLRMQLRHCLSWLLRISSSSVRRASRSSGVLVLTTISLATGSTQAA